jgi:release factor glutamine methyltransferase
MQVIELYEEVRQRLSKLPAVYDAKAEADQVLRHRLGMSPTERLQFARGEVGEAAAAAVESAVAQREDGAPLAYALGRADFAGSTFIVTPAVLIPRPETEWLVRRAEDFLLERRYGKRRNTNADARAAGDSLGELTLLDLGCGSGCIGITLALRYPQLRVTLADVSPAALEVAEQNARKHGVLERCEFREGDWFAWARRRERCDMILCNPPYVTRRDDPELEAQVREHEPAIALFLEGDPEEFFFRLGRKAVSHLNNGGLFAVEVGYDTAWPARNAFERINALNRGKGINDFSGIERVIWGIRR